MMKYCKRCDKVLDAALFTRSKSRKDGLQAYCQECMKSYRIEHYRANKQQYYDRNLKTDSRLNNLILQIKKSGCIDCKEKFDDDPWVLEFDHLHDKSFNISILKKCGSEKKLLEEISKCELVCANCHRKRTAIRAGWNKNKLDAGCSS